MIKGGEVKSIELNNNLDRLLPTFKNIYYHATLGNLIYGIIHNLNGTIQLLTMNMELLEMTFKREKSSPSILHYFEKCMEYIDKLRKSLDIILPKGDYEELQTRPIHLNELLEEQLLFLQNNLFYKHQVKVNKVFTPRLPAITGCSFDFRIAILNLIQNSLEALESSPIKELTLMTKEQEGYIHLLIKDTGCGISEETAPYLFQPFFTTKSNHLGLGLYITQRVMHHYGTQIQYHSRDGETIFALKIPVNRS